MANLYNLARMTTATTGSGTATVTITNASPAVVSWSAHGFAAGQPVRFSTTGALPTGLTVGTIYYVIAAGLLTGSFEVSATPGGSAINTSSAGSGTHTGQAALQLGTAVSGYLTMALSGAVDLEPLPYAIKDTANSEIGLGTYISSGTWLMRSVTNSTNSNAPISLSGAAEVAITPRATDLRTRLTANLTVYVVMLTGNDTTATGTAALPFKTLTAARNFAQAKYDLDGFVITFNCDGTTAFTAGLTALGPFVGQAGPSSEVWDFVAGSVVTGATDSYAVQAAYGAKFSITQSANNLTLNTAGGTAGIGVVVTDGGFINILNIVSFNTCARSFLQTNWGGTIIYNGAFFTGNCYAPFEVSGGLLQGNPSTTTTYTGNPTVTRAVAWAYNGGTLGLAGVTFTPLGTVTGKRYEVGSGATMSTGGSETYFPGTIAGVETGGVYIRAVDQSEKGSAKAWFSATVAAGVVTVNDSFNITSVVRTAAGIFNVTLTTPMSSVNYVVIPVTNNATVTAASYFAVASITSSSVFHIEVANSAVSANNDPAKFSAVVFGVQ